MIFYRIALFVLAFNLTLAFVNSMPIDNLGNDLDDNPFSINEDNNWNITSRFSQWNASAQNLGVNNLGFGDVPGGFIMFVGALSDATVTMPFMLASFGLPTPFIAIFTGLIWLTYGAGALQIWSGRNPEQ